MLLALLLGGRQVSLFSGGKHIFTWRSFPLVGKFLVLRLYLLFGGGRLIIYLHIFLSLLLAGATLLLLCGLWLAPLGGSLSNSIVRAPLPFLPACAKVLLALLVLELSAIFGGCEKVVLWLLFSDGGMFSSAA